MIRPRWGSWYAAPWAPRWCATGSVAVCVTWPAGIWGRFLEVACLWCAPIPGRRPHARRISPPSSTWYSAYCCGGRVGPFAGNDDDTAGEKGPAIGRGPDAGSADCRIPPLRQSAARTPLPVLARSEEHTSELQSRVDLVCRLLL